MSPALLSSFHPSGGGLQGRVIIVQSLQSLVTDLGFMETGALFRLKKKRKEKPALSLCVWEDKGCGFLLAGSSEPSTEQGRVTATAAPAGTEAGRTLGILSPAY